MKTLTPEQQVIALKWEQERAERDKLITELEVAEKNGDGEAFQIILGKIMDTTPEFCEHDRSIMVGCAACEEIERIIHPELFQYEDE